jgi:hypothetical protein
MSRLKVLGLASLLSLLTGAASAAVVSVSITGGTGSGILGTPASGQVGNDNINVNALYAFDEQQNVVLASDLAISGGTIAAGTGVASHYIAFDPERGSRIEAAVEFNRQILGVIVTRAGLSASNGLGLSTIVYNDSRLIGIEGNDGLSVSGNTLTLSWRAANPGDHIRVITAAVPLPAGGLALLGAMGGLALLYRRRKATAGL